MVLKFCSQGLSQKSFSLCFNYFNGLRPFLDVDKGKLSKTPKTCPKVKYKLPTDLQPQTTTFHPQKNAASTTKQQNLLTI
jgi:hypothetical protein